MSIGKGFADPIRDTQSMFRRILWAMSHPGDIVDLHSSAEVPDGLAPAAGVVLLTLADVDTQVWLPEPGGQPWHRWLAFHSGAPRCDQVAQAVFAVVGTSGDGPLPSEFCAGDDRYPDRSATVIALCDALDGGPPVDVRGPGIAGTRSIAPCGPDNRFWRACIDNSGLYPRGVDLLLVAGTRLLALPRSLTLRPLELHPCT